MSVRTPGLTGRRGARGFRLGTGRPSGARFVERLDIRRIQLQAHGGHEALQLLERRRAGDRRRNARARDQPRKRHGRERAAVAFRHEIERRENADAAMIQILLHARAARAFRQILARPVLARQKAACEAVIGHDRNLLGQRNGLQIGLIGGAVVQVVLRLHDLILGQIVFLRDGEGFLDARARVVRRARHPNLAGLDQPLIRAQRFFERHLLVVFVREIHVDVIGLKATQRIFNGGFDIRGRQPRMARPLGNLGGDHDLVALAAAREPFADDRLRLAALVARHPGGVDVGGIDEIQARVGERVENRERGGFVGGPAEHVAAEHERCDLQGGSADPALFHGGSRLRWANGCGPAARADPRRLSIRRLVSACSEPSHNAWHRRAEAMTVRARVDARRPCASRALRPHTSTRAPPRVPSSRNPAAKRQRGPDDLVHVVVAILRESSAEMDLVTQRVRQRTIALVEPIVRVVVHGVVLDLAALPGRRIFARHQRLVGLQAQIEMLVFDDTCPRHGLLRVVDDSVALKVAHRENLALETQRAILERAQSIVEERIECAGVDDQVIRAHPRVAIGIEVDAGFHLGTFEHLFDDSRIAADRNALIPVIEVVVVEREAHRKPLHRGGRHVARVSPPLLCRVAFDEQLVERRPDRGKTELLHIRRVVVRHELGREALARRFRRTRAEHLVQRQQIDRKAVQRVAMRNLDAIDVMIEVRELTHVIPDLLGIGVKDVRAINVLMAIGGFFVSREDIAANVLALLDHLARMALPTQLIRANRSIQAGANDKNIHLTRCFRCVTVFRRRPS
ncbi:hypothetical protein PT2222_200147 [Paraburkholderia tropica]